MRVLKLLASLAGTLALIVALNSKLGVAPPLGKFLDPFHGFLQNAETADRPEQQNLKLPGLQAEATVVYDDRHVPHIFAENNHDLYFLQGYVTAQDRLWQMEFQTHAAAGRLSEFIGPRTLDYDRHQRRIGMTVGAQNALKRLEQDPVMRAVVRAYTDGVNAHINSLQPEDYPVEYKVMDYSPEAWTPLKTALLLEYMAWMLTGRSSDLQMSNTLARFGPQVVADLFPSYPKNMDPVVPAGTRWNFKPVELQLPEKSFSPAQASRRTAFEPDPDNGSNNWAVSGEKTASGYPILSNDPHLRLNLPSIWYEIQLHAPGVNTYGVSLPGSPNVIVGFNQQVAWGVTNSEADVLDWYEIKFKDKYLSEYWHDNQWRQTRRVVEEIKIRGQATILDTVVYTHHGPIVVLPGEKAFKRHAPTLHAMRWLGHDTGGEALAFYQLNRAQNYDDYVAALSHYACPAQNFIFADSSNIAIWHNGRMPAKWQNQGKFIGDGSDPRYDWQAWVPHDQNPHIKNPKRGFVSSANQNATDPSYPYYLNWYFAPYFRGARINEWLASSYNITPKDMRILQLDTKSMHAESVLPALLKLVDRGRLDTMELRVLDNIAAWDYFSDAAKTAPTVFDEWWGKLYSAIWQDDFGDGYLRWPHKDRTALLISEKPTSGWFDDKNTAATETAGDIALATFKATVSELTEQLGEFSPPANGQLNPRWQWGKFKGTDIDHLGRIPGLGRQNLDVGGDRGIVNATGRKHGPSWRMVVALGPEVKAWGTYPGGQSGNPGSAHYDEFVKTWMEGELDELLFMKDKHAGSGRTLSTIQLRGK